MNQLAPRIARAVAAAVLQAKNRTMVVKHYTDNSPTPSVQDVLEASSLLHVEGQGNYSGYKISFSKGQSCMAPSDLAEN